MQIIGVADHIGADKYTVWGAIDELERLGMSRKRNGDSLPELAVPYLCAIAHPEAVITVGKGTPEELFNDMAKAQLIAALPSDFRRYDEAALRAWALEVDFTRPPFVHSLDIRSVLLLQRSRPITPPFAHRWLWIGLDKARKARAFSKLVDKYRLSFSAGVIYLGWITSRKYVVPPGEGVETVPQHLLDLNVQPVHLIKLDKGEGGIVGQVGSWAVSKRKCGRGYPDEGGTYDVEDRGPGGTLLHHVIDPPLPVRQELLPARGWVYADIKQLFAGEDVWLAGKSLDSHLQSEADREVAE